MKSIINDFESTVRIGSTGATHGNSHATEYSVASEHTTPNVSSGSKTMLLDDNLNNLAQIFTTQNKHVVEKPSPINEEMSIEEQFDLFMPNKSEIDDFVDFVAEEQDDTFVDVDTLGGEDDVDKMLSPRKSIQVNRDNILSSTTPPSSLLSFSSATILNSFSNTNQDLIHYNTHAISNAPASLADFSFKSAFPSVMDNEMIPSSLSSTPSTPTYSSFHSRNYLFAPLTPLRPPLSPMMNSPFTPGTPTCVKVTISPNQDASSTSPIKITRSMHRNKKICSNCGVTKAPVWRKGPLGTSTLCNACGLKYSLGTINLDPNTGAVIGKTGFLIFVDGDDECSSFSEGISPSSSTSQSSDVFESEDQMEKKKKKKKTSPKKRKLAVEDDLLDEERSSAYMMGDQQSSETKLNVLGEELQPSVIIESSEVPAKRGRGRPRKKTLSEQEIQIQMNKKDQSVVSSNRRASRSRKNSISEQKKGSRKRRNSEMDIRDDSEFTIDMNLVNEIDSNINYAKRSSIRHIRRPSRFEDSDNEIPSEQEVNHFSNIIKVPISMLKKRDFENEDDDMTDESPVTDGNVRACIQQKLTINTSEFGIQSPIN